MILKCVVCGKEMTAQRQNKLYCSIECQRAARKERIKNKNSSLKKTCVICGKEFIVQDKSANRRQYCYDCLPKGKTATRSTYISMIKKLHGNKCQICGYDKCITALEFHHLNPEDKEGIVSDSYGTVNESLKEAEKCILICANCHREIHEGLTKVPEELWKEVLL